MKKLLGSVKDSYDYITIDLPAIIPIADVKAVSHLIEHFILIIGYNHTSQDAVFDALRMAPLVSQKVTGGRTKQGGKS
jgi:polysaccharide biosynthesis transport protein